MRAFSQGARIVSGSIVIGLARFDTTSEHSEARLDETLWPTNNSKPTAPRDATGRAAMKRLPAAEVLV
jgi:hypothetical protein